MDTPVKTPPHVVTGLIAKRRELAGEIERLQAELNTKIDGLGHIDAAIRIFSGDIDPSLIPPRKPATPYIAAKGENSRIILDAIRTSDRPLSTAELLEIVMQRRGLNQDDYALRRLMRDRVKSSLKYWRDKGIIVAVVGDGIANYWTCQP
jgi:hypothetical protein